MGLAPGVRMGRTETGILSLGVRAQRSGRGKREAEERQARSGGADVMRGRAETATNSGEWIDRDTIQQTTTTNTQTETSVDSMGTSGESFAEVNVLGLLLTDGSAMARGHGVIPISGDRLN